MHSLQDRMVSAMVVVGYGKTTQKIYLREARLLGEFFCKTLDEITDDELQVYLSHRVCVDKLCHSTMRICFAGLKFFLVKVLGREWLCLDWIQFNRETMLPAVLERSEIAEILRMTRTHQNRAFFTVVYSCGLLLQEGLHLQVGDIHAERKVIQIHRGKQAKDRLVPLVERTLYLLRAYWKKHRNRDFIFPSLGWDGKQGPTSTQPMAISTVQRALKQVVLECRIPHRRITMHTLPHSYATHLLEAGVNIRQVQEWLGHSNLETTMLYLHLTQQGSVWPGIASDGWQAAASFQSGVMVRENRN